MTNPVSPDQRRKKSGNKMAVSNILQRFELAYGKRAKVTVQESDREYSVLLIFPYDEVGT
jgi:hypothetical protein